MVPVPGIPEAEPENRVVLLGLIPAALRSPLAWSSSYPFCWSLSYLPSRSSLDTNLLTLTQHKESGRPGCQQVPHSAGKLPSISSPYLDNLGP